MPRAPCSRKVPGTTYVGTTTRMLDELGEKRCKLILQTHSLELVSRDPVVVRQKWFKKKGNLKKMLSLLTNGFMFKKERLNYIREVMLYMLRHNKLHVDDSVIDAKTRRHNLMRKRFFDFVSTASRGGDHDEVIPLEVR